MAEPYGCCLCPGLGHQPAPPSSTLFMHAAHHGPTLHRPHLTRPPPAPGPLTPSDDCPQASWGTTCSAARSSTPLPSTQSSNGCLGCSSTTCRSSTTLRTWPPSSAQPIRAGPSEGAVGREAVGPGAAGLGAAQRGAGAGCWGQGCEASMVCGDGAQHFAGRGIICHVARPATFQPLSKRICCFRPPSSHTGQRSASTRRPRSPALPPPASLSWTRMLPPGLRPRLRAWSRRRRGSRRRWRAGCGLRLALPSSNEAAAGLPIAHVARWPVAWEELQASQIVTMHVCFLRVLRVALLLC
jgi:hypothetical protein